MLIVTIGISGSGKSTWAKSTGLNIVSPDEIRKELTGDISDQTQNKRVWELAYKKTRELLSEGNVIFDSTATSLATVKSLMNLAEECNSDIMFKFFDGTPDTCYNRIVKDIKGNINRSNVPLEVVKRQFDGFKTCSNYIKQNYSDYIMG